VKACGGEGARKNTHSLINMHLVGHKPKNITAQKAKIPENI
jgi:hypothetical protein